MRNLHDEQGSSILEFVVLVPVLLVLTLGGFTEIHHIQMRQLVVTSLARELSRAIELGQSPRQVVSTLETMRLNLGLSESPALKLTSISSDSVTLSVSYKGQRFQTQMSLENASPAWQNSIRSEIGSMLPFSLSLFAVLGLTFALVTNYGSALVADFRANQLATEWALAEAEQTNGARESAVDLEPSISDTLDWSVSRVDGKTSEVVVCYRYEPIFAFWQAEKPKACARKAARVVSR
ncbi:MAG: TadE/TadG family type IV pilus assembly protein [Microbacteriaceae bacterium]